MRNLHEIIRLGGGPDLAGLHDAGIHVTDSARPCVPYLLDHPDPVVQQAGRLLGSSIVSYDDAMARAVGIPGPALRQADAAYQAYLGQAYLGQPEPPK